MVSVFIGISTTCFYLIRGDQLEKMFPIPVWTWNLIVLLSLAYLSYDSFYGSLDLLGNSIQFVVLLQIIRLLSPKTSRDWLQIYGLSFLHLVASTVISSDMSFAIIFVLYLVLSTWTLSLFNLQTQANDAWMEKEPHRFERLNLSKGIITTRFFSLSAVLALSLLGSSLIIFFSFPRLSFGQFLRRATDPEDISGFSEEVELGTLGNIKNNPTIVFRAEIPNLKELGIYYDDIYWRGTATDLFDGRKWIQTRPQKVRVGLDISNPTYEDESAVYPDARLLEYSIFLEALSTPIIFTPDRLYRIEWKKNIVERIFRRGFFIHKNPHYGSISLLTQRHYLADLVYFGQSWVGRPEPEKLRKIRDPFPESIKEIYLQLPELHPEVIDLFDSINPPTSNLFDRVTYLKQFIQQNYRYTLDVQDVGVSDPLWFFFIKRKKGHCEYFSTAYSMLLRYHGIPVRQVMGFRGGELNPYGNYITVRESNAHSWVEVFFPKYGWIRLDPTPPDRILVDARELLKPMYQFFDYLRLRWNRYIVDYDLKSQIAAIQAIYRIGRQFGQLVTPNSNESQIETDEENQGTSSREWSIKNLIYLFAGLLIFLFLWYLRTRVFGQKKEEYIYRKVERAFLKHGIKRLPNETPYDFEKKVNSKLGRMRTLNEINTYYYSYKFNQEDFTQKKWRYFMAKLRKELQYKKKSHQNSQLN